MAFIQNGDVWVKQLPNGTPQRLTTDGHDFFPKWSASGKWLLYRKVVPPRSDTQTWIVRSDGTGARQLDTNDDTAWSPTDDVLAYIDGNGDLNLVNADGSSQRVLVQHAANGPGTDDDETLAYPRWSPDGKTIAFSRWTRQNTLYSGLWSVDVASRKRQSSTATRPSPARTQEPSGPMIAAAWSKDSQNVYFWHSPDL